MSVIETRPAIQEMLFKMEDRRVIDIANSCTPSQKALGREVYICKKGAGIITDYMALGYSEFLRRRLGELCRVELEKAGRWKRLTSVVKIGPSRSILTW